MVGTAIWLDGFDYARVISPDLGAPSTPGGFAAIVGRIDSLFKPDHVIVPLDFLLPEKAGSADAYVRALDDAVSGGLDRQIASLFGALPPALSQRAVPQLPGPAEVLSGLDGGDDDDLRDEASFALTDIVRALSVSSSTVVLICDRDPLAADLCGSLLRILNHQDKKTAIRGRYDGSFDMSFATEHCLGQAGQAAVGADTIVTIDPGAHPEDVLNAYRDIGRDLAGGA